MPSNHPKDLKTEAIVLRRTNYGEADRILNLLTPEGKLSVLARSVRKPKSKLAGAIELFCLSEVVVHQGKSDLGILTSAKMKTHYSNLLSDLETLELATDFLKKLNRATEQVADPAFFGLLVQSFTALDQTPDRSTKLLTKIWFHLNLQKLIGEEPNFYCDTKGEKLRSEMIYTWDAYEKALAPDPNGKITKNEIKLARLLLSSPLALAQKIQNPDPFLNNLADLCYN